METHQSNISQEVNDSAVDTFDFGKLLFTLRKSLIWIILFVTLSVTTAYLIVRYTKPLYESSSLIKLDFESEATSLGLVNNGPIQQDLSGISGEIEILKSRLFLSRVAEAVNYDVSYHFYGRYLTAERYRNSPFVVSHRVKNTSLYERPIDIQLIDEREFLITYNYGEEKSIRGSYGEDIRTEDMNILVEKTRHFSPDVLGKYFFIFHSRDALVQYFQTNCDVVPENFNAQTIRISLKDFNQTKAKVFLTAIDTLYLEYTKEEKNRTIDQKIAFLDSEIAKTQDTIQQFEDYFEGLIIENKTIDIQSDLARTIKQISQLDSQKLDLDFRIVALNSMVSEMLERDTFTIDRYTLNQFPNFLKSAIESYQTEIDIRTEKLASYNENTHVIEQINLRVEQKKRTLLDLFDNYQQGLKESLKLVTDQRRSMEENFSQLPSMGTEYNKNRRLYTLQESFLTSLRQSKMQLELTKAGTVTNGTLLSPASFPTTPIRPRKLIIIGAGLAISLVLSLFFVIVRYLLNNYITSVQELEKLSPAPILGSVPFYTKEKLPLTKLIVNKSLKSALSESLRTIRTNMDFLNIDKTAKTVTITSTISGEGKTFIAVNLGAIIASTDKKVCIVDLDLRRPKVHTAFEHDTRSYGTSTFLIGKSEFDQCILDTQVQNLFYIPAGPTPPNPSELVLSDRFNAFMDLLKERFDLIIFDTPPVGLVTDAILVMKKTDLQFYVVKAQYSRRAFAKTITDLVKVNKFSQMTVIFNGVKNGMNGYGYGYGYGGYGYGGYGYGYYEDGNKPKSRLASLISSLF